MGSGALFLQKDIALPSYIYFSYVPASHTTIILCF